MLEDMRQPQAPILCINTPNNFLFLFYDNSGVQGSFCAPRLILGAESPPTCGKPNWSRSKALHGRATKEFIAPERFRTRDIRREQTPSPSSWPPDQPLGINATNDLQNMKSLIQTSHTASEFFWLVFA